MYGRTLQASAVGASGTLAMTGVVENVFWITVLAITVMLVGIALMKLVPKKQV